MITQSLIEWSLANFNHVVLQPGMTFLTSQSEILDYRFVNRFMYAEIYTIQLIN